MKIRKELWFNYLVYISFIPLLVKGISYLTVQVFSPFLISVLVISSILFMLKYKSHTAFRTIKIWSLIIITYGSVRLLLFGLILLDESVIPSLTFYQFNFWYHFKTLAFIILGYICLMKRKYYLV